MQQEERDEFRRELIDATRKSVVFISEFAKQDAKIGDTLRIRMPADYVKTDGPGAPLTYYDALFDGVVPVTQEWIDNAQRDMRNMLAEIASLKQALNAPLTVVVQRHPPEVAVYTPTALCGMEDDAVRSEIDHIWNTIREAART